MTPLGTALTLLALSQAPAPAPAAPEPPRPAPPLPAALLAPGPQPYVPSLLTAEPLKGGTMLEASLGWPRFRLAYAQGVAPTTDLGLFADLDHSTTELRMGGTYRGRIIPDLRPFDGALRLSLAWYHDFGGRWIYRHNHRDEGIEVFLGASYSRRGGGAVLSVLGELPITVTFQKDRGVLVNPRAAFAYQRSLYGSFTAGLELGLGLRTGVGNAPVRKGVGEVTLLALGGWRIL